MKVSDIITYITKIMEFDFKKIRSSSFRNKQKSFKKLRFTIKLRLDRWWESRLVYKIAKTKTHQTFLAPKYDIKQHSDAA